MTPAQAWEHFHERIEAVTWAAHVRNPATMNDDRQIIPVWAMRVIFEETWRCAQSVGLGD